MVIWFDLFANCGWTVLVLNGCVGLLLFALGLYVDCYCYEFITLFWIWC